MRSLRTVLLASLVLILASCASTGGATGGGTAGSGGTDTGTSGSGGGGESLPSGTIVVDRATAALGIEQREPVNVGESFLISDERVYIWTEVLGGNGTSVRHVYYHDGHQTNEVILSVRADRWRTWSYKTLLPGREGNWRVDIVAKDGTVLESVNFTVESDY